MIRDFLCAAVLVTSVVAAGCGPGTSTVGGGGGTGGSGVGGGSAGGSGGGSGVGGGAGGGSGGGGTTNCPDADGDTYSSCIVDCDDTNKDIYPGAPETLNQKDDDCDGKIDNHIPGQDKDLDGTPYATDGGGDCNDDEPLVGPMAIEDPANMVDDNCNGAKDEPIALCDDTATTTGADSFAKALGLCSTAAFPMVTAASFPIGNVASRSIRTKFGDGFVPRSGSKMIMLSTGQAKDLYDDANYHPQGGYGFGTKNTHPLYSPPRCAAPATTPQAEDMSELSLTLKVPQNAKSLSFNFSFFSAEYPEWSCTEYNDRFLAILESAGLDKTKLPADQCTSATKPTCNISYDSTNQPVSVNNGFFDICVSDSGGTGPTWSNTCTKPTTMLLKTGYQEMLVSSSASRFPNQTKMAGGATGWLKSTAPVKPGETIVLRFIVLDEGDGALDSAVLIDNLKWEVTAVSAPVTVDPGIN